MLPAETDILTTTAAICIYAFSLSQSNLAGTFCDVCKENLVLFYSVSIFSFWSIINGKSVELEGSHYQTTEFKLNTVVIEFKLNTVVFKRQSSKHFQIGRYVFKHFAVKNTQHHFL